MQLFPDDAMPGEAISLGGEPVSESAYAGSAYLADTSAPAGTGEEPALPPPYVYVRYPSGVPYHNLPIRQRIALDAAVSRQGGPGAQGLKYEPSTINETDLQSLWRELGGIWRNIGLVCNPFLKKSDVTAMLQHWDLWGPLVCHKLPLLHVCCLVLMHLNAHFLQVHLQANKKKHSTAESCQTKAKLFQCLSTASRPLSRHTLHVV